MLEISPGFVTSHLYQLWDRDDTYLNVAGLLGSWSCARFQNTLYNRDVDFAMFSVATEFHRRGLPYAKGASSEMRPRRYSMLFKGSFTRITESLVSWEALSTCHEASYVLKLQDTAAKIAWDDTGLEPDTAGTRQISQVQASDPDKSLDIGILELYCALTQIWKLFHATFRGLLYPYKSPCQCSTSVPQCRHITTTLK